MKKYITLIALLVCSQALAADRATIVDRNGNELGTSGNPIRVSLAGGGGNSFETINTSSGTDPVADSSTDTLNLTAGSGITITGDSATDTVTIAASGSGDVTTVGDCATGDCFSGTSGTTLTFDTNGGTYGNDATLALDQTENYVKLSASGFADGGGNFSPLLYLQSLQTGTAAIMLTRAQNGTMANFGAQGAGYMQMMHHPGSGTSGYGIMSYLTEIYPAYFNGNAAAFAQSGYGSLSNNTMSFGTSSYRWAGIYSVLGNFSGAVTASTELNVGGTDLGGRLNVDGTADEVQMWVQGHSTQTSNIVLVEKSDGTDILTVANTGSMKLVPVASPPGTPASGDIYVDSTASPDELCFYDGAAWQGISSGTDANCA